MGLGGKEECAWQRTDLYDMLGSKERPHATQQVPTEKLPLSLPDSWLTVEVVHY